MKNRIRILMVLVFLLAFAGALLLVTFVIQINTPLTDTGSVMINSEEERALVLNRSRASQLLSRMGLLPNLRSERNIVTFVVENHEDARQYQEGIEGALLVEEWLVEGFISRFAALFDSAVLPERIGPIRSLRSYFVEGSAPWSTVFVHAGGSPDAIALVEDHEELQSINGITGAYYDYYERDESIPAPHNFYLNRENLTHITESLHWDPVMWPPYTIGKPAKEAQKTEHIELNFFNPLHNVQYTFDEQMQLYTRTNGPVTSKAMPANILILEIPIEAIGELGRLTIPVQGAGAAVLFRSGTVTEGFWNKEDLQTAFRFTDIDGEPLIFAKGLTWMTVLPTMDRLSWKSLESNESDNENTSPEK